MWPNATRSWRCAGAAAAYLAAGVLAAAMWAPMMTGASRWLVVGFAAVFVVLGVTLLAAVVAPRTDDDALDMSCR